MARELRIDIHDMYVSLSGIPDDSFVVLARRRVSLDIDAQRSVDLELQAVP